MGLIGGSIAAALKRQDGGCHIIGIGRNQSRLEAARAAGVIDEAATNSAALSQCDLVVVCTPVDRIIEDVQSAAQHLRSGALVTDAGSVKERICRGLRTGLPDGVRFVGSHPLAGSEKNGWEHSDADLFQDRVCVVTPDDSTAPDACEQVTAFWQRLGMRVLRMSPAEHDRALAATSHVPHVAAAAVASLLTGELHDLASTGFRDTTRIAAGDPDLWTAILLENAESVGLRLNELGQRLSEFRAAIEAGNSEQLRRLLQTAKEQRDQLP